MACCRAWRWSELLVDSGCLQMAGEKCGGYRVGTSFHALLKLQVAAAPWLVWWNPNDRSKHPHERLNSSFEGEDLETGGGWSKGMPSVNEDTVRPSYIPFHINANVLTRLANLLVFHPMPLLYNHPAAMFNGHTITTVRFLPCGNKPSRHQRKRLTPYA
jgi:hypothetical protein